MYSEQEASEATLKYFDGDELATNTFITKYALRNEKDQLLEKTPEDMHRRLAKEFARIEAKKFKKPMSEDEIFSYFDHFKYIIPQGSPMTAVGNPYQLMSVSNCFVLECPQDSYGGIHRTDEQLSQISKRRGGTGLDLSNLRPKGTPTKNSSKTSSGIIPFMERFSTSIREVGQDGRRGALMQTISVHHPEVLEFARAKLDNTKVTGANVSIRLSDEFLKAVEEGKEYEQRWPVEGQSKISKMVDARTIWHEIIKCAHARAEPGLLFWDNIIKNSPADCYASLDYKTVCTNPCIHGDTLIAVADGRNAVSIRQLAIEGKDVPVYSVCPITGQRQIKIARNPRLTQSKAEVWKLIMDDGSFLIATPDHKIMKKDKTYINLKDLQPGDSLHAFNSFDNNGYRQITETGQLMKGGRIRNRRQYRLIHEFHSQTIVDAKQFAIHHKDFDSFNDSYENLQVLPHEEHRTIHSKNMMGQLNPYHRMDQKWKTKFARHPGETNGRYSGHTNEELLKHGRKLFNKFGKLTQKIWRKYAEENHLPRILKTPFRFGTFGNFKNQVCDNHKVVSIEKYGYEDVYNLIVDDNNNYDIITLYGKQYIVSSGITIKNCGELPLCELDSCRLMLMNLFSFVEEPFTKNAHFDYGKFFQHVQVAQRLMDDLVDIELEQIEKIYTKVLLDPEPSYIKNVEINLWSQIKQKCYNGRRTGLGTTGLGDVLAALNIPYGSDKSIKTTEDIYRTLKFGAYKSSVDMAEELGAFPIYDSKLEENHPFLEELKNSVDSDGSQVYKRMKQFGRRNIALLTQSPAGSVSIETQTTSGIEPALFLSLTRRKKINHNDKDSKVDFVDVTGDKYQEFEVFHPKLKHWMSVTGETDIKKSPWYGCCADDLDWKQRIKLQAAAQHHIDHSISSTLNLPEDVTIEKVKEIYEEAWKQGLKGVTVYRQNCRSGVLVEKKNTIKRNDAPTRPKELDCDVYHVSVKGKKYFVLIGLYGDDRQPYEVFAGRGNLIDEKVKTGKIVKVRTNFYKAILEDETELSPITLGTSENQEVLTRFLSQNLRHGVPIEYVIEQISKVESDLGSFAKDISRSLKKYIKNDTKSGEKCECGANLVYEGGCVICKQCGYSKCG